jgi:hypothetical protein
MLTFNQSGPSRTFGHNFQSHFDMLSLKWVIRLNAWLFFVIGLAILLDTENFRYMALSTSMNAETSIIANGFGYVERGFFFRRILTDCFI